MPVEPRISPRFATLAFRVAAALVVCLLRHGTHELAGFNRAAALIDFFAAVFANHLSCERGRRQSNNRKHSEEYTLHGSNATSEGGKLKLAAFLRDQSDLTAFAPSPSGFRRDPGIQPLFRSF